MKYGVLVIYEGECVHAVFYPESPTDEDIENLKEELRTMANPELVGEMDKLGFRIMDKDIAISEMERMG